MTGGDKQILRSIAGRPIVISLPANPTTGFKWELDFCDSKLECIELPYRQLSRGIGAGGIQQFKITSQKAGEFFIRFRLKRSWETKVREVRNYKLIAEIK